MTRRRTTAIVALAGVVAVIVYAVLAAVQILAWTPLAAAPGLSLDEIRGEMRAAGESLHEVTTIGILAVGPLIAAVVAVIAIRARAHPMVPIMTHLSVLALGAPGFFIASFGAGMSLADTFDIGGGLSLPGVRIFYAVSAFAAVVVIAGIFVGAFRTRSRGLPASA